MKKEKKIEYESKVKKEIAKTIFGDIGKVLLIILGIIGGIGILCASFYGAYSLLSIVPNDYLYLTIVEGFIGLCVLVGVSICQYADGETITAYLRSTISKVLYPILNFVICLGFAYILKLIFEPVLNSISEEPIARGGILSIIILIMLLVKFGWYVLDPIGFYIKRLFEKADNLQKEINKTEKEKIKEHEKRIEELQNQTETLKEHIEVLNDLSKQIES